VTPIILRLDSLFGLIFVIQMSTEIKGFQVDSRMVTSTEFGCGVIEVAISSVLTE
jgi:hypothetical protein